MEAQLKRNADGVYYTHQIALNAKRLAALGGFEMPRKDLDMLRAAESAIQRASQNASEYRPIDWLLPAELWVAILEFVVDPIRSPHVFGKEGVVWRRASIDWPIHKRPFRGATFRLVCREWAAIIGRMVTSVRVPTHVGYLTGDCATLVHQAFPGARVIHFERTSFEKGRFRDRFPAAAWRAAKSTLDALFAKYPGVLLATRYYAPLKNDPEINTSGAVHIEGYRSPKLLNLADEITWVQPVSGMRFCSILMGETCTSVATERSKTTGVCFELHRKSTVFYFTSVAWRVYWINLSDLECMVNSHHLARETTFHVARLIQCISDMRPIFAAQWAQPIRVVFYVSAEAFREFSLDTEVTTNANLQLQCPELGVVINLN